MANDASLIDALRAWAPMVASGYECPAAAQRMVEAADRIAALRAVLEELADLHDGDDPVGYVHVTCHLALT